MNPHIEKLCLPHHRRDAIWKFWQPNAKLEKIHPPIYWKSLDYKRTYSKAKTIVKSNQRLCSEGCHYTTLIYENQFRIFIDFEHNSLQHSTWKELNQEKDIEIKPKSSIIVDPWLNLNNTKQSLNDCYLKRQELDRYFKSHISKDKLFELDRSLYPNRSIPISRRPRDVLHIDFYQADALKGSKIEATFKTFYHRKYLLPRYLREHTLKDLLSFATDAGLNIEIIGHFILHPNELSKHEIEMFELTSEFGDIYEGHIIRINQEKLVLLLTSTYHSHIKLSQSKNLKNITDEPKSTLEQIILNHVREYFEKNHSIEQIRRIEIEFEPLINQEKRRVILHLLSDKEIIENLTFEITYEQEPKFFTKEFQMNFYFIQNINEQIMISSLENQLKHYSLIQQEEYNLEKIFYAYANHSLSAYSREECMRIAIEYSFDDLLDEIDSKEFQLNINNQQIQLMIDEVQRRLHWKVEQRLKAEATAKILLIGPPIKKEINSIGKEVVVLNHHREIFIASSDTSNGPSKLEDIQRNTGQIIYHEEIEGGPKSFDRLPMSIDSLTILKRIQQRKRLANERNDKNLILLGSGIRRLVTSETQEQNSSLSIECEQDKIISLDQDNSNSIKTFNTTSYNTSAHTKEIDLKKFHRVNQQKNKRISRSPAEYGKYKQKRKRCKPDESTSKIFDDHVNLKHAFFNNLFLLQQNKKQKMIKSRDHTRKNFKSSKFVNTNAITENSNTTISTNSNDEDLNMSLNENNSIDYKNESVEEQQFQDEGFQDKDDSLETSEKSYDTKRNLRSLYGSLSSTMKYVHEIYESKSSRLRASLDLAHIFITFLHIRKDTAHEIASTIIAARKHLIQPISTQESSSSSVIVSKSDLDEDNDIISISSGIVSSENSETIISEQSSISDDEHQLNNPDIIEKTKYSSYLNKNIYSSNSQHIMNRIITYLSEADWRVFNYITKYFLQGGSVVTNHALEFSSALLMDLIEDNVYRAYFHLKWCPDSCLALNTQTPTEDIKNTFIEKFFKKSIDNLFNHLQLINLPLLENIALMQTLKKYTSTDLLKEFNSVQSHPVPIGRDPCIWFSTDILIKTIYSLTNDILNKMNDDYLSDYTKFEYLLISYFRKIEIVQNLQDLIKNNQHQKAMESSGIINNNRFLLHVIDLNQAPKFFSDQAFKRFKLGEQSYLNDDTEALKDLVLLDIQKRNVKSVKRPYLPLSMSDLLVQQQNRVISPSPWILAQYHRQSGAHTDKSNLRKDSYQFDETTDSSKIDNLSSEVRALFDNMIKNYGTIEEHLAMQDTRDQDEGLSEEDVAQLIENAIEAVERFDRENNIGDRKLQNKKTVNDRLTEFFKYAGRHGVRLLDDVLKVAKLRSNDPKKYLPLAVNMLRDRLQQNDKRRVRKQGVRFAHTLETLLAATNDEPELVMKMLKKPSKKQTFSISEKSSKEFLETKLDSLQRITELTEPISDTNVLSYPKQMSTIDKYRQTLPMVNETVESTTSIISKPTISQLGLTVAQLVVLAIGQDQEPLKLTNVQIEQICLKQGISSDQLQHYVNKLMQTTKIPNKLILTKEQLVQIAIEEDISLAEVERIRTSQDSFQLTESQIQSLVVQINMVNSASLVLHLNQLIELCHQQKIDLDEFLEKETALQNASLFDSAKLKFTLSSSQIAYLVNENQFDIRELMLIEQNLKTQGQQFRLNSSQLAYLLANHRIVHSHDNVGLSAAQLIGLYMLHQQSIEDEQTSLFSLSYQQIIQLALLQNMSLEHLQSLSGSPKPFQLTQNQLIYISMESKIPIKQVESVQNNQKSKVLDHEQLCILFNQSNEPHTMQKSTHIHLNVEQIFFLAKNSNIKLNQLRTCASESIDIVEFRFKSEQLAALWNTSSNDSEHNTLLPSQFILSDEQFSSLLHLVSIPVLSTHSQSIISMKSNEPINITPTLIDTQSQLPSSLADQLTAMHERLKSSLQTHVETVKIVSNSMLKRNRIENTLNLVHQLSLHSIDNVSNKEVETIPSFVLDLLKMETMPETLYTSIKKGEITSDTLDRPVDLDTNSKEIVDFIANGNLSKTIIEGIQDNQLSFSQIHKIQTQLLTPKLIDEFKSGHLSQHVLDAYKSLSPLQIINKVRSSITQLNKLITQPPTIASNINIVNKLPQTVQQEPLIIYPESAILRQEILQELRDHLNTQLIKLKNEYGIEPIKGKASIQQITNKIQTMPITKDLESLIDRHIDEVDILNILEGHINHLLVQVPIDINKTNELFDHNIKQRLNRINERIQLVNILKNHIENERLKRQMNLEEFTALILEDIPKFEQLTHLHLTEDDLRIISMNRFASLERAIKYPLNESEYRHLLQTNLPFEYIEEKLLNRSLTSEERLEYEELVEDKTSISYEKVLEKLTHPQLEQILQRRAELVDQYDILHSISPSIKLIEEHLNRSLTIDEKKRLIHDDYSIIKKPKSQNILPITSSIFQLVENTQDKNLVENIKHLEIDLKRSLTKQELIMTATGDINNLEKHIDKSLSSDTIKSIYNNRFINLTDELNRNLTEKEIRDILSGKLSGIEKALGRQLTSTERLTYKPVNIIDLTASQLENTSSIDTTVEELEDVLERRLTSHEIQYLTDQQKVSDDKLDIDEQHEIDVQERKSLKDNSVEDSFIFGRLLKKPILFSLSEIEKAIGRSLNSDELERFAGSRFNQIENDLGKSLTDLQRSNLLNGDKLTIEGLINRKLSHKEIGPHLIDLINIEKILNRSLTFDELINLAGDRFDEIQRILQRSLIQEELIDLLNGNYEKIKKIIDEELDKQKEIELKQLPINRIRYFEKILRRKLSANELLRFAEDRFEPLIRLLSDNMKSEQILDLSSGRYDKFETFFGRSLTRKEKYELDKSILQVHRKYSNILDEFEYIIQRRLNEEELRILIENQYDEIEIRLGKLLTEKQLRNILHGNCDSSLNEVEDLCNQIRIKYDDNSKRTQVIADRLIERLDDEYKEHQKDTMEIKSLKASSRTPSIQQKEPNVDFHQTTNDLLKRLSDDVRENIIVSRRASKISDDKSISNESPSREESPSNKEISPILVSPPSSIHQTESLKAFESIPRIVEQIADKEHIEEMTTVINAIDKFQEKLPKNVVETATAWLSNVNKDAIPPLLPTSHESYPTHSPTDENIYLGWKLFKGADRPDLGLKDEKPRIINVKHTAQTYVVGIPEEYADDRSKMIANKIYQGGSIVYRSSKSRIMKEIGEFISQVFHLPIINDATHFIVPSRAYIDISESMNTYQSELIEIEDDDLHMRDSPETLEWYEECIQRNVQVYAHIPTGYQPSIVYCHTGRRTVITPAARAQQRKISLANSVEKSTTPLDQPADISVFNNEFIERLNQPISNIQPTEPISTAQTVTDLIMHTVTICQKSDLLEALDELFSQENLDKYQMTETHWQDIFLILLNSYLRSHSLNRKDIFKRLTDKLHELRMKEHQRSSEPYPNISITTPSIIQTPSSLNDIDITVTKQKQFRSGERSPSGSMNSGQTVNESEYSITPAVTRRQSLISHESIVLPVNENHSPILTSKIINHDSISMEHPSRNPSDTKLYIPSNSNAIIRNQRPSTSMKHRQYKITVMHSDEIFNIPINKYSKATESIKLPSIVSKKTSSQTKRSTSIGLTDSQLLLYSSTNKRISKK